MRFIRRLVDPRHRVILVVGLLDLALNCRDLVHQGHTRGKHRGAFKLRRGFHVEPGQKVVMLEDIVTTGLSSRECIAAIEAAGGTVVAAACIVDRSGGRADVGVPLVALATLDVPAYPADALPPELAALPVEDPGSRRLAKG